MVRIPPNTPRNLNPIKWLDKKFQKDPEKALAYLTVASIIAKDGYGCYMYVKQSLNNKEIPEKRRNFVAATDLTNGALMILAQIAMFAAMRKYSEPLFNKLFKKSFNPKLECEIAERIRMNQKQVGKSISRKIEIGKEHKEVRKDALEAFKYVLEIGAATIIGKRVIVPFISTPLANIVKDKWEAKNKQTKETENAKLQQDIKNNDKVEDIDDVIEEHMEEKLENFEDKIDEIIENELNNQRKNNSDSDDSDDD